MRRRMNEPVAYTASGFSSIPFPVEFGTTFVTTRQARRGCLKRALGRHPLSLRAQRSNLSSMLINRLEIASSSACGGLLAMTTCDIHPDFWDSTRGYTTHDESFVGHDLSEHDYPVEDIVGKSVTLQEIVTL